MLAETCVYLTIFTRKINIDSKLLKTVHNEKLNIAKLSGNIGHNSAPSIKVARVPVYSEKLFSQDLEFILVSC